MLPSLLLGSTFGTASGIFASSACERFGVACFCGAVEQADIPESSNTSKICLRNTTEGTLIMECLEILFNTGVTRILIVILTDIHVVFSLVTQWQNTIGVNEKTFRNLSRRIDTVP